MPGMSYKIKFIVTRKLEGVNHFHYYLCRQLKGGGMEINMEDITALHPRLQLKATQLKEECKKQGISILFGECLRIVTEQDALYSLGRTAPGNIVTNAKGSTYSSQHQWGITVDFYLNMDVDGDGSKGNDSFNNSTGLFDRVRSIAQTLGLG